MTSTADEMLTVSGDLTVHSGKRLSLSCLSGATVSAPLEHYRFWLERNHSSNLAVVLRPEWNSARACEIQAFASTIGP